MAKIKPNGIVPQKSGPVFTCNDPLSIKNGGGSKTKSNGVTRQPSGPTINVSNGLVNMPTADKSPPMTKVKSSSSSKVELSGLKTATKMVASGGSGGFPSVK